MLNKVKNCFYRLVELYKRFHLLINTILTLGMLELLAYSDSLITLFLVPEFGPILIAILIIVVPISIYVRKRRARKKELNDKPSNDE